MRVHHLSNESETVFEGEKFQCVVRFLGEVSKERPKEGDLVRL